MFWVADETGGEAVLAAEAKEAFPRLVERVRTRYSLQYRTPESKSGTFRRVEVRLSSAAKLRYPDSKVKARRGYYAHE